MLAKRSDHEVFEMLRRKILGSNLKYARSPVPGSRQDGTKAEIVREDHVIVVAGPTENVAIGSTWGTYRRPVDCINPVTLENRNPRGGEVHVDHDPHGRARGISISSARQAA